MIRVLLLIALLLTAGTAHARRVAIVVANQNYAHVPVLANPLRDARAVAAALGPEGLGFDQVERIDNADLRALLRLPARVRDLARGADTVVVYLAGHGMRDAGRNNYLLPIDADINAERDIEAEGLNIEAIVAEVRAAAPRVGLIIVDACRDNPFYDRTGTRSLDRGLARRGSDGLDGILIAYSADAGQRAQDGAAGALSPFAAALVKRLRQPGTRVLDMLDEVRDEVGAATAGRQTPTRDGNLRVSAVLVPGVATVIVTPQRPVVAETEAPQLARARQALARVTPQLATSEATKQIYARYLTAGGSRAGLEALANANDVNAMTLLGTMLSDGFDGQPPDLAAAVRLLGAAAKRGNARALNNYATLYNNGEGVGQDKREAARFFKLSSDQGFVLARVNLAILYANGQGVAQNYMEAARLYKLAADQGYARAQYNLGYFYAEGKGVIKDKVEAARLYKLAADQGERDAQYNLAIFYAKGEGVPRNEAEAARLLKLLAGGGDPDAQNYLGYLYDVGQGLVPNKQEAARLYKLASDQGNANAQTNLGRMYANGEGVAQNAVEAIRLYKLAAAQGSASALVNLGYLYDVGQGVAQNKEEAARLYKLAADKGDAGAQGNLGIFYEYGVGGLPLDREAAITWYRKAAAQNHQKAIAALKRLGVTP